jgi:hypothetical protein
VAQFGRVELPAEGQADRIDGDAVNVRSIILERQLTGEPSDRFGGQLLPVSASAAASNSTQRSSWTLRLNQCAGLISRRMCSFACRPHRSHGYHANSCIPSARAAG